MCLIVFAWRPGHAWPLLVAANRDEFYARPSQPLGLWQEAPGVYAGRDLKAGGTWLGIGPDGRFAALTNIRDPQRPTGRRSRGELPGDFLRGRLPIADYLHRLAARTQDYAGFNLLLGDDRELWYFNALDAAPIRLPPGLYGLSNARLDTPWPKLLRARTALATCLEAPRTEGLLGLLGDRQQGADAELPDTGIGRARERLLSSVFIASQHYGTRCSTALLVAANGSRTLVERRFGPHGARLGEVQLQV